MTIGPDDHPSTSPSGERAIVGGGRALITLHPHRTTIVTVLPDSNKKYLSTDLCQKEPMRGGYLTPRIHLDRFCDPL